MFRPWRQLHITVRLLIRSPGTVTHHRIMEDLRRLLTLPVLVGMGMEMLIRGMVEDMPLPRMDTAMRRQTMVGMRHLLTL